MDLVPLPDLEQKQSYIKKYLWKFNKKILSNSSRVAPIFCYLPAMADPLIIFPMQEKVLILFLNKSS